MKWYTFLIAITLLFVQCGGDEDGDSGPPDTRNTDFGNVTMKIDGKQTVMRAYNPAFISGTDINPDGKMRLQAVNCENLINIDLTMTAEIGAHEISGLYTTDKEGRECFKRPSWEAFIGFQHRIIGNCNVTEMGDRIKGTFEFTTEPIHNNEHYVITDGSFDVEISYD